MLRVMTLNLNYHVEKHGPWPARRELVLEALQEARPDTVLLQAVEAAPNEAGGRDQAHELAELLPEYEYAYFQLADSCDDGSARGSGFLSRLPLAVDCLELSLIPGLEDPNQRVLLHARLDLPSGPLHLFNGHLSWVYRQARSNLAESLPYISSFSGPALLAGDMNTQPDSDLWQPLRNAGWVDSWDALRPDQHGYTYESDRLFMRIDYVWANALLAGRVKAIEVVNKDRGGAQMSDHAALILEIE